jgi:hypothetical protein
MNITDNMDQIHLDRLTNLPTNITVVDSKTQINRGVVYNVMPLLNFATDADRHEVAMHIGYREPVETSGAKILLRKVGYKVGNPQLDKEIEKIVHACLELDTDGPVFNKQNVMGALEPEERDMLDARMDNIVTYMNMMREVAKREAVALRLKHEYENPPEFVPSPKTMQRPEKFELPEELKRVYIDHLNIDPERVDEYFHHRTVEVLQEGKRPKARFYFAPRIPCGPDS